MKLIMLIVSGILYSVFVYGQHSLMANNNENVLYVGTHNSIDFLVQQYPCDRFILKADSCTIEPTDNPCTYTVYPKVPGKIKVCIQNKKNGKIENCFSFRSKILPPPIISLSGRKNGEYSISAIKVQIGLVAFLDGFNIDIRFEVLSFAVIIIRDQKTVFYHENIGAAFDPAVKNALQDIKVDDRIIFLSGKYKGPNDKTGDLNSAEFKITK